MQLNNQMYAALTVVGIGLLTTVWYLLPAGGSYPIESETMCFGVPAADRRVVPARTAFEPLVPAAAARRTYNPFTLEIQVHRNDIDRLGVPPPPPLASPLPPPAPLPPLER